MDTTGLIGVACLPTHGPVPGCLLSILLVPSFLYPHSTSAFPPTWTSYLFVSFLISSEITRGLAGLCVQIQSNVFFFHQKHIATDQGPLCLREQLSSDGFPSYRRQVSHDSTQRTRKSSREDASSLEVSVQAVSVSVSSTRVPFHTAGPGLAVPHIECLM